MIGVFTNNGLVQRAFDLLGEKPQPQVITASLFFRDEKFGITDLPFDLLVNESHSLEFDITEFAVENGGSLSDHINEKLRKVVITGMFTNHSINDRENYYTTGNTENDKIKEGEPDTININDVPSITNTSLERLEKLKEIARKREAVRVVTALEVYEKMFIEALSYDRDPNDGESVTFKIKLKEIKTAKVETEYRNGVWTPPEPPKQETEAQKKLSKNNKKGKVSATEQTSATLFKEGLGKVELQSSK